MTSPARPSIRSGIPWGLVGMILLACAVERYVARHKEGLFLNLETWGWGWTGQVARRAGPAAEILCFGDSLVKVGIAAPIVEERTGRRTLNLALAGGQAPASYFLLRRALASGARPRAVMVDFLPCLLMTTHRDSQGRWAGLLDLREALDLALTARDPDVLASIAVGKLLPSFRARHEIRATVAEALQGEINPYTRHVPAFFRRNLDVNRGGMIFPHRPGRTQDLDAWSKTYFPSPWSCNPVHAAYVRRFLDLAAERGIPVFWLLPPLQPDLQDRCDRNGHDATLTRFVREARAGRANVTVVDGRRSGLDAGLFFDPHHLSVRGAAAWSEEVAAVVRGTLDPSSDRRQRPEVALEDLEQSKVALANRGRNRRQ